MNVDRFLYSKPLNLTNIDNYPRNGYPIKTSLVLKQKNKGKIESHLWFFKGFCQYLQPKFTVIIDAGTIPLRKSLSKLVMSMQAQDNVAGLCGEIEVLIPDKKDDGSEFDLYENFIM